MTVAMDHVTFDQNEARPDNHANEYNKSTHFVSIKQNQHQTSKNNQQN